MAARLALKGIFISERMPTSQPTGLVQGRSTPVADLLLHLKFLLGIQVARRGLFITKRHPGLPALLALLGANGNEAEQPGDQALVSRQWALGTRH
jgi:hypothetical protein